MLISYKTLQKFFDEPLPEAETLSELLTHHAFEVEKVTPIGDDFIFDIKVLPDRAHYALSHRGVSYEVAAILGLKRNGEARAKPAQADAENSSLGNLKIQISEADLCARYMIREIKNVTVTDSPAWLQEFLKSIDQRSINNIVDALNYIMFYVGQPLHAFDADKVEGELEIRLAKAGERITLLDDKEIVLNENALVIADKVGPLAIAGIKGGKRAEVNAHTKNILIEAASFQASNVRKTSTELNLRNESSKRFENAITPELAVIGLEKVTSEILILSPGAEVAETIDIYPNKAPQEKISINPKEINDTLGITIPREEIIKILEKLEIQIEDQEEKLLMTIPYERLDLKSAIDIPEEVGRLYGFSKIPSEALSKVAESKNLNKNFYYQNSIRKILGQAGFSEIYTPSIVNKGEIEIINPLASDKKSARSNLTDNLVKSLQLNLHNIELLGLEEIKIFEMGKVFTKNGEFTSLAIGVAHPAGFKGESVNEEIRKVREYLLSHLDTKIMTLCTTDDTGGLLMLEKEHIGVINKVDGIMELNLDKLIGDLPSPDLESELLSDTLGNRTSQSYSSISIYPFVLRDIAVFVTGEKGREEEVLEIIKKEAGALLVRARLFDVFTKINKETEETKTSYAYRLVFQSAERTLTDAEINKIMDKITTALNAKDQWSVR